MSREAIDALEKWHATARALREATPWTSEWVRLRMVAEEQRAVYESLIDEADAATDRSLHPRDREQQRVQESGGDDRIRTGE